MSRGAPPPYFGSLASSSQISPTWLAQVAVIANPEWLGQMTIRPRLIRPRDVVDRLGRRENDDRNGPARLRRPDRCWHFKTAEPRQVKIEQSKMHRCGVWKAAPPSRIRSSPRRSGGSRRRSFAEWLDQGVKAVSSCPGNTSKNPCKAPWRAQQGATSCWPLR